MWSHGGCVAGPLPPRPGSRGGCHAHWFLAGLQKWKPILQIKQLFYQLIACQSAESLQHNSFKGTPLLTGSLPVCKMGTNIIV
ncbi:hypothetical protein DPMN_121181 [Dreissena polymorpha]|uniref:Uncharacterized protein n=1 Tax=Dreissena polymorpha TaxID=45954 RepID=A0A9D4GQ17_DREPO|nr:hypothetical protein DPMN_121181 [Dreissena polymorpha]